jgi:hypothetical protein
MAIERKFPVSPFGVLCKIDVFLQKRGILLREEDRKKMQISKDCIQAWWKRSVDSARHRDDGDVFIEPVSI